jgi:hypothetical protein
MMVDNCFGNQEMTLCRKYMSIFHSQVIGRNKVQDNQNLIDRGHYFYMEKVPNQLSDQPDGAESY